VLIEVSWISLCFQAWESESFRNSVIGTCTKIFPHVCHVSVEQEFSKAHCFA